jgi:CHAD domain-containing protein
LEVVPPAERAGLDFLVGYSLGQRHAAQGVLESVEQNQPQSFDGFTNETIDAVRAPHDDGKTALIDLARPMLRSLVRSLRQAAEGDLEDYDQLHQVRIAGKRLRYAMEVFASCFAPAFREVTYPQVEEMQEILGRANDSHVAATRLALLRENSSAYAATWERVKGGIESLMGYHQGQLPQERGRFLAWWQAWQQGDGEAMLAGDG